MGLTKAQQAKKRQVESEGGVFVPPSQYNKYKKGAVRTNPNMVASYSAKKQYKPLYKEIGPDCERVVDQILDPETASSNAIRWPNTYGNSAIYSVKNVINAKFDATNRCAVAVHPRLRNAIYTTFGGVSEFMIYPYDLANPDNPDPRPYFYQQISVQRPQYVNITNPITYYDKHTTLPFPDENTGQILYPLGIGSSNGGNTLNMYFTFPQANAGQITVERSLYGPTFGLIDSTFLKTDVNGKVAVPIYTGNGSTPPSYLSVRVTTNGTPWAGVMSGYFATGGNGSPGDRIFYQLPNVAQHMIAYDIKDTDTLLESAEKYIMLAQSLLLTSQMSDINNGGALAIARVPGGTNIGEGSGSIDSNNWYEWLASLSTNNYDGPSRKGGYGFYLPEDERGFFYRDNAEFSGHRFPYLASEFTVADTTEGSIMRIKVCSIIQFTTNSSTFQLAPSPICYESKEVHHLLSIVNACYENETHKEALKQHLRKIGGRVKKVIKNPQNWVKMAEALSMLLI